MFPVVIPGENCGAWAEQLRATGSASKHADATAINLSPTRMLDNVVTARRHYNGFSPPPARQASSFPRYCPDARHKPIRQPSGKERQLEIPNHSGVFGSATVNIQQLVVGGVMRGV
jgi:hypothetical protein